MASIRTLVTVLNYRGEETLFPCLASLIPTLEAGDVLLVVDNGAETALLQSAKERFPRVEVITTGQNLGFAAGMNVGLGRALAGGFDAAWIVNNDTVIAPGALSELKRAANMLPGLNLFSPLIVTPGGEPWFAGGEIDWLRMRTKHVFRRPASPEPFTTRFLTGCALFIPRAVLETVGLLDETYFLYYEDADYSIRTLRQGGRLFVVPGAMVTHSEASQANPEKLYWLVRSGVTFFFRQAGGGRRLLVGLCFWLRRFKNWLRRRFFPSAVAETLERAYTDALKTL